MQPRLRRPRHSPSWAEEFFGADAQTGEPNYPGETDHTDPYRTGPSIDNPAFTWRPWWWQSESLPGEESGDVAANADWLLANGWTGLYAAPPTGEGYGDWRNLTEGQKAHLVSYRHNHGGLIPGEDPPPASPPPSGGGTADGATPGGGDASTSGDGPIGTVIPPGGFGGGAAALLADGAVTGNGRGETPPRAQSADDLEDSCDCTYSKSEGDEDLGVYEDKQSEFVVGRKVRAAEGSEEAGAYPTPIFGDVMVERVLDDGTVRRIPEPIVQQADDGSRDDAEAWNEFFREYDEDDVNKYLRGVFANAFIGSDRIVGPRKDLPAAFQPESIAKEFLKHYGDSNEELQGYLLVFGALGHTIEARDFWTDDYDVDLANGHLYVTVDKYIFFNMTSEDIAEQVRQALHNEYYPITNLGETWGQFGRRISYGLFELGLGTGEMFVGTAVAMAPEPFLTKVGGGGLAVFGLNTFVRGGTSLYRRDGGRSPLIEAAGAYGYFMSGEEGAETAKLWMNIGGTFFEFGGAGNVGKLAAVKVTDVPKDVLAAFGNLRGGGRALLNQLKNLPAAAGNLAKQGISPRLLPAIARVCRYPRSPSSQKVIIVIGGEGRHSGAFNVNPSKITSTTGTPGRKIPNHIPFDGKRLPFGDNSADIIYLEGAPLTPETITEIARVIKPGENIRLVSPQDYGASLHRAIAEAVNGKVFQTVFPSKGGIILHTNIIVPIKHK